MPRVRVDGCEIHYEVTGSGSPVVLLHGLGSSTLDWEFQVSALAEHHTVITIDFRGHGRSDKPKGPYRIAMFAGDVARVIETLALGPVNVVGLSLGGMVAFQLAVDAPSLIRSLVIVNSGPAALFRTLGERFAIFLRFVLLRVVGVRGLAKAIANKNFPRPDQVTLREKLATRLGQNDPAPYRATTEAIVGWSVEERIGNIQISTLVVTADQDYTPVSLKRAYAAKMPRARVVVIDDSRHVTPWDQPEKFNRILLDFFAEQAKEGGGHDSTSQT